MTEFRRFFTRFTEDNDHEGETWTFWLQRDDNEDALRWLGRLIRDHELDGDEYASFVLDLNVTLAERDVDLLVTYGGAGYMRLHTKVVGRLTVTPDLDLDTLYKGGVVKLFASIDATTEVEKE